ncbi:MAG: type I secretion system permease/ATPase [Pseudomonadota bacterium]
MTSERDKPGSDRAPGPATATGDPSSPEPAGDVPVRTADAKAARAARNKTGFTPVPSPPRRSMVTEPIRLVPNAQSEDFSHLPSASRARLEALIDGKISLAERDNSDDTAEPNALKQAPGASDEPTETAQESDSLAPASRGADEAEPETPASTPPDAATVPPEPAEPPQPPPTTQPSQATQVASQATETPDPSPTVDPAPSERATAAQAEPSRPPPNALSNASAGRRSDQSGELLAALKEGRGPLIGVALFSCVINLLMLAGPLFMLQVYDRVMTSGSLPTLIALLALTLSLYVIIGLLEMIRARVVVRMGLEFDQRVADRIFRAAMRRSAVGRATSVPALRELDSVRQFMSGPGPLSLLDAPWTPIYLCVVFALHWVLGVVATAGAVILIAFAWLSERASRKPLIDAGRQAAGAIELAEIGQRNAEAITAMGMTDAVRSRWEAINRSALDLQTLAADRLGALTATTKTLRLALQSIMLAIGAALALDGAITAGTIVAATIIFGRALAPVELALSQWRTVVKVIESFGKLDELLRLQPEATQKTQLPAPAGHLKVTDLKIAAPDSRNLLLANVSFALEPGQMVAIVGPSASGKSTLARALVGVWPPAGGRIRLDGAALDQWHPDELGKYVGYLPQEIELFSGSVRDNIARFQANARDTDIVDAAKQAYAHDLILSLPQGYETDIGTCGAHLSAGQRQRIALARALFTNPVLVVLDEPNANLDRAGDQALSAAIDGMRKRGQAIVLVSHRMQAIAKADLLLVIEKGLQRDFGRRDEVLRRLQAASMAGETDPATGGRVAEGARA